MDDNIGTLLTQVARMMRRNFDARARAAGITRPQWQVLSVLSRHEGINQGGLADLLEVEPMTLGRMIDRMQDSRMVERRPDPADRRAWRLFLTPEGRTRLEAMRPLAAQTVGDALAGLDAAQQAALAATLVHMRANLSPRQAVDAPAGT